VQLEIHVFEAVSVWSSRQLAHLMMQCKYNWLLFGSFSVLIFICPCVDETKTILWNSVHMNNNSRNYAHESTLNHFSCDAGSKRRSSYAPLKNEDSGIMDDETNTEVCPIAHPYFQTVFLIVLIFIFIFLWSPGLSYKPSSLPILLLDGWALHYHPPCFFHFSSNDY